VCQTNVAMTLRPLALLFCGLGLVLAGCAADSSEDPNADIESEDSEIARKTTLTFFLVGQEYDQRAEEWKKVPLDSLNADLERAGLKKFNKAITVGAQDGAKFEEILTRLEEANQKLNRKVEFDHTWDPSEYEGLCYNGTAAGVGKVVEGLRGSAFSEYMGVQAERWGSKKKVHNETESEWLRFQREDNDQGDTIKAWESFDGRSSKYLMFTDGGQQGDGTELFATIIDRCR
jgi:hypothetical protein